MLANQGFAQCELAKLEVPRNTEIRMEVKEKNPNTCFCGLVSCSQLGEIIKALGLESNSEGVFPFSHTSFSTPVSSPVL